MMFDTNDIKRVQSQRPDLSADQASDVLGFLMDTYNIESYNMDSDELFKETASLMFPLVDDTHKMYGETK